MTKPNLMVNIVQVAEGRHAPAGTALDYCREALAWAARCAEPGESPSEALQRLILERSPVVHVIYQAADRAARTEGTDQ